MKITKIDVVLISVLFALIVVEFVVKSEELSSYQVLMGIVIGFSLGFKLSAVHGSTVSREAIKIASEKDHMVSSLEGEKVRNQREFEVEHDRKERLIRTLEDNLRDRDEEIRYLVKQLEDLKKGG